MAFSHQELKDLIEQEIQHYDEEETLELQNILIEINDIVGIESIALAPLFISPDNNLMGHTYKSFIVTEQILDEELFKTLYDKLAELIDRILESFTIYKDSDLITLEIYNL